MTNWIEYQDHLGVPIKVQLEIGQEVVLSDGTKGKVEKITKCEITVSGIRFKKSNFVRRGDDPMGWLPCYIAMTGLVYWPLIGETYD